VPVGEDQAAHIEMCREVARRFGQVYAEVFPIPEALLGRVPRLPGLDGNHKMSKSLGNAIFLSDDTATIRAKMAKLHTGRQSITEPGDPNSALFVYARTFMTDQARVAELEDRYTRGDHIGDAAIKIEVATAIDALIEPMRARRAALDGVAGEARIRDMLREHTRRANAVANETLALAKAAMQLAF